jgi:predicted dehydrogenase
MLKAAEHRRLRAGIVGGGAGSFIGAIHRIAAEMDGEARIVAGALSSNPQRAEESARAWHLERSYASYAQMAVTEAGLGEGIDFVIVATPNHLHHPVASAFLAAGIPVVCDKPLALSVAQAESLAALARDSNTLLALTHNYTGYPMVRQARALVRAGAVGDIRKVLVEYNQDWLMTPLEQSGHRQAEWRMDPARAGASCCVADIGTHAENLLEYITGERITALCADLSTFVPGRPLDDDANILLRLSGGGKGTLVCSQVACGETNALGIRIYGSKAGLEWRQEAAGVLRHTPAGEPARTLVAGDAGLAPAARAACRLPPGHPEGYLEAFANLYRAVIGDIRRAARGEPLQRDYPGVDDGVRGLRFVAAAVESSRAGARWVNL